MRKSGRFEWSGVFGRFLVGPLVVLGCGWFAGCYQFVQVDPAAAPTGTRVRVELTSEGSSRLAQVMGGEEERRIEGRVVGASPDGGMVLEVAGGSGATPSGISSRPMFSRVRVPAGDLMSLELKQLNGKRTAVLVGAGVAAAAVIVTAAFNIGISGDGEGSGPGVDQTLIPLFSLRIGR